MTRWSQTVQMQTEHAETFKHVHSRSHIVICSGALAFQPLKIKQLLFSSRLIAFVPINGCMEKPELCSTAMGGVQTTDNRADVADGDAFPFGSSEVLATAK